MTDNAQPSRNPADSSGDIPGGMREILGKFLQSAIDDMLPAKIIAYDRDANRATVKPLIAMVTTTGENVSRNQLASIPVLNIGGGGCILSFNLKPGDLGWIKANDRDVADFLKRYSEAVPSTKRIHDFNNGLFIPDVMTGYTIHEEDKDNAVLQTLDGTVRVSLFPDKLKLTAPTVEVNATTKHVVNTPLCEINAATKCVINTAEFEVNAPIAKINAVTTITGVTTIAGGTIAINGALTNDGVNVGKTHNHSQANDSNGDSQSNTGVPQ